MTPWIWIPILLIISTIFLKKKKDEANNQKQHLPPGPPQLPIIGNLHQLGALPHQSLWKLSQKYGPVVFLKLGRVPTVVVSSAETARQVLKDHDIDSCSRPYLAGPKRLSYNFLDMGFSPFGDYWREIRKICVLELFNTKRVQSFRCAREEEVAALIHSISESASLNAPVDLSEKFLYLTASVTCKVSFGFSFRGSEVGNGVFQEVMREAFAMLGSFSASDLFPGVGWIVDIWTGLHRRREKSFRDLDAFYEQAIAYHVGSKKTENKEEDFIDVLLKLEQDQSGPLKLTKNHIKALLMDIFLAGVDTSALTMTWAMTELARNPNVMTKLQAEIRYHMGEKRMINEDDLEKFEYLKMVVKETLRLHPPSVLLIPRETMSHFKIDGYDIAPKTRIQVNVWAMGRDPNLWEEPQKFFPERFAKSTIDFKGQHFEFLPFGAGRRGCPGIYMGVVIVELALANLLFHFDWKLPEGMIEEDISMEEVAGLTIDKKEPINLVPVEH